MTLMLAPGIRKLRAVPILLLYTGQLGRGGCRVRVSMGAGAKTVFRDTLVQYAVCGTATVRSSGRMLTSNVSFDSDYSGEDDAQTTFSQVSLTLHPWIAALYRILLIGWVGRLRDTGGAEGVRSGHLGHQVL